MADADIATAGDLHPYPIAGGAAGLFEDGRGKRATEEAANEEELYEQIGRLKMEVEWLKKKAAELG